MTHALRGSARGPRNALLIQLGQWRHAKNLEETRSAGHAAAKEVGQLVEGGVRDVEHVGDEAYVLGLGA
jgi:hypothetical protein